VLRTRVGYAGGTTQNPTYGSLGDHSETIQIEYDPAVISYSALLDVFWGSHRPTRPAWSRQYASAVFYHNEEQKRLALEGKVRHEANLGQKIYTDIAPFTGFHLAEDYHQKHQLRRVPELERELRAIYPELGDFVGSTAVTRVNGYLGGYGTLERLQTEIEDLGLSVAGRKLLLDIVAASRR